MRDLKRALWNLKVNPIATLLIACLFKSLADDNLPSISDLLKPYRKDSLPNTSGSGSSYIPFGSISGSTHEGKSIFFKRKLSSKKNQRGKRLV